jgi:hypothetical protein
MRDRPGACASRLARRLATLVPAMTLAEAIETTRIPRVAGLTGRHAAFVTARPCRAPHHPIADVGLIGGGQIPGPAQGRGRPTAAGASTSGPRAHATGWRCCANRSRMASQEYNLPHVLNLHTLAGLALRMMAVRDAGSR